MPFSSGTYSRVYNWTTESASPPVNIAKLDTQEEDIAAALSTCILRDGTGLPTATINWNGQRITNLGAATAATDGVRASQLQSGGLVTLGSVAGTNTITGSLAPAITAYTAGMLLTFTPANNNTGAATLAVNGLTALDIQKADGDALISGDLIAGIPAVLVLDSGADDWILLNPQASILGQAIAAYAKYADTTANFTGTLQYGGVEVGYRGLPRRSVSTTDTATQDDNGKGLLLTGATFTQTLGALADTTTFTLFGNDTASKTIAPGSGSLYWFNGSGTTSTGNRTLAIGGVATVTRIGTDWYIWGTGIS